MRHLVVWFVMVVGSSTLHGACATWIIRERFLSNLPTFWAEAGAASSAVLLTTLGLAPLLGRTFGLNPVVRSLTWISYIWMALIGIAAFLLVVDWALSALVADFRLPLWFTLVTTVAVFLTGMRGALRQPSLRRIDIPLASWHQEDLTIAHLTDLHLGPFLGRRWLTEVVT